MVSASTIAELCVYILTWNVGGKYPQDTTLDGVLGVNGTHNCPQHQIPDIYVIALQEVNTQPKNQFLNIFNDDAWVYGVRETLNAQGYVKLETKQLQGLLIMMFVQPRHVTHINDIEAENTRTGLGGLWGNKGGVSIRMSLYGTGVVFVGAHLAAHDEMLKQRVEDYNTIVNSHKFKTRKYETIFDHDFVFWFGDLNFRLTGTDSSTDIIVLVEAGELNELFKLDQLSLVREMGHAFSLLNEQQPTFPPTFKFVTGTSNYNPQRRPAWCDRILYRVVEDKYPDIKLSVEQLSYRSHPDYVLSDHKPVSAEFIYKIESLTATHTDAEIYEATHGGSFTPLASVIILFASYACLIIF